MSESLLIDTHIALWLDTKDQRLRPETLISTAIELGCPMVTYDSPIIDFAKTGGRRYGFSVVT